MRRKLVLASASPRRKEILGQMGLTFEICPASGEEKLASSDPEEAVKILSLQKAPCDGGRVYRGLRLSSARTRWWLMEKRFSGSLRTGRMPAGCCGCFLAIPIWYIRG